MIRVTRTGALTSLGRATVKALAAHAEESANPTLEGYCEWALGRHVARRADGIEACRLYLEVGTEEAVRAFDKIATPH